MDSGSRFGAVAFRYDGGVDFEGNFSEYWLADKYADKENRKALLDGASPVFLVDRGVMMAAVNASNRLPEGERDEMVGSMALWNAMLPECDLAKRVQSAVSSTIGATIIESGWPEQEVSEKDVEAVMSAGKGRKSI